MTTTSNSLPILTEICPTLQNYHFCICKMCDKFHKNIAGNHSDGYNMALVKFDVDQTEGKNRTKLENTSMEQLVDLMCVAK